jgi:hypothetical protein
MICQRTRRILAVCGLTALVSMAATAQDKQNEVNLSTTIIGNQEQPKVLYIVPWKPVDASELQSLGIQSQLDMVFGHVEPVELRRELRFRKQLSGNKRSEATE